MKATTHVEAQWLHCFRDCGSAAHCSRRPVEGRKKSVAEALDLAPAKSRELLPNRVVMPVKQALPFPVAKLGRSLCRFDDVSEQDCRKAPGPLQSPCATRSGTPPFPQ